jgi:NADPH-dependent 2,4-dienoyl-CoA reductase/sulfur reductase-like enzyme
VAERLGADVAVVGAGPAGLAAACEAAEAGRRVVVIDEAPGLGGQIWRHRGEAPRGAAAAWLARLRASTATVLQGASVFEAQAGELFVERGGRGLRVAAERLVLCTGARERFLPFPGWTLPGVLGAGAAQALLKSGARFSGKRVVVAGSGPLLLPVAAALRQDGADVRLVAEQASLARMASFVLGLWRSPGKLLDAARYRLALGLRRYRSGAWVTEASGDGRLANVALTDGRRAWHERCDVLCCGYGLVPNVELGRLLGCAMDGDALAVDEWQATGVPGVLAAGEPTGVAGVEQAVCTGRIAGLVAADRRDDARRLFGARARGRAFAARLAQAFALRPELRTLAGTDTLVCRCEDVPCASLGGGGRRELKLRTRAGMGACQGRVCGPALEFLFGGAPDRARPPLVPVPLALLEED